MINETNEFYIISTIKPSLNLKNQITNLLIDAGGTGTINLNTVADQGIIITQTDNSGMAFKITGPSGNRSILMGRSVQYNSKLQTTIQASDNVDVIG